MVARLNKIEKKLEAYKDDLTTLIREAQKLEIEHPKVKAFGELKLDLQQLRVYTHNILKKGR